MTMRRLIEAVSINESDGEYTPAINAALEQIQAGFEALHDAAVASCEEITKAYSLMPEWRDCIVATYLGHGMPCFKILVTDEMITKAKTDDEYADDLRRTISTLNHNAASVELIMELENEHRNAVGDFEVTFLNGQPLSWNDFMDRSHELTRLGWGASNF